MEIKQICLFAMLGSALLLSSNVYANPGITQLIEQLQGKNCNYEWQYDPELRDDRCAKRGFHFLEWLFTMEVEQDCRCRGQAAACLGSMGTDASMAVPALMAYVKDGPTDVDNGDGGSSCLSTVLYSLGKLKDERALPVLIEYVSAPRRERPLTGAMKPGRLAGLREALTALREYGDKASGAIVPLRSWLDPNKPEYKYVQADAIRTLQELGDKEQVRTAGEKLERFRELLSQPVQDRYVTMVEFGSIRATIKMLAYWAKQDQLLVQPLGNDLKATLQLFEHDVPRWLDQNINGEAWHSSTENQMREVLLEIRQSTIIVLGWLREDGVVAVLPDILSARKISREELVEIFSGYGDRIESLFPSLVTIAYDLQFEDIPLDQTISGTKSARAGTIIEILKRNGSPPAVDALREISKNKHLRRRAGKALRELGS